METTERGVVIPDYNGWRVVYILFVLRGPATLETIAKLFKTPRLGYPKLPGNLQEIVDELTAGKWFDKEGDTYQITDDMVSFLFFSGVARPAVNFDAGYRRAVRNDFRRIKRGRQ